MRFLLVIIGLTWTSLWFTPDQAGQRLFKKGKFKEAAETFEDPVWEGIAWYRAGEFKKAGQAFARRDNPEAHYNHGNALLLQGQYENAVTFYERALTKRPDWHEAQENRDLAAARAALLKQEGGDMGDQKIGADEVRFDANKKPGGQDTEVTGEQAISDASVQEVWLRRVQTRPADFLRAKFAQQAAQEGGAP
jgi:Ca-activated chloride channel family protein